MFAFQSREASGPKKCSEGSLFPKEIAVNFAGACEANSDYRRLIHTLGNYGEVAEIKARHKQLINSGYNFKYKYQCDGNWSSSRKSSVKCFQNMTDGE